MLFKIIGDKPYYYKDGEVYYTAISGNSVTVGKKAKVKIDNDALYTLMEIKAKLTNLSSIEETKE